MILKDLLRRSFRMIQVLKEGQQMNVDDVTDAIYVLNDMLGGWNINPLDIFNTREDTFTLIPSQQEYSIGPGGDFNAPRPEKIQRANLIWTTSTPNFHKALEIVNVDQRAAIRLPALQSTMPTKLYYKPTFPLGTIRLWPVVNQSWQLELFTWAALPTFATVDDQVTLPDGYSEAIASNLAVRLAAEWGKPLRPETAVLARESKAAIESHNAPSPIMECDSIGIGGRGSGGFNRLTGDFG
jgi:hypothetical protein